MLRRWMATGLLVLLIVYGGTAFGIDDGDQGSSYKVGISYDQFVSSLL